jgi:potassium channel subfamily K
MHEAFMKEKRAHPEAFKPHSDFVRKAHEMYGRSRKAVVGDNPEPAPVTGDKEGSDSVDTAVEGDKEDVRHEEGGTGSVDDDQSDGVEAGDRRDEGGIKRKHRQGRKDEDDQFATNQRRISQDFRSMEGSSRGCGGGSGGSDRQDESEKETKRHHRVQVDMMKQLMDLTVQLEAEARQMMLDSMDKGIARTLLLADRNGMRFNPLPWIIR